MLFHVRIDVRIPHDLDPEKPKELSTKEHERAKELQLQHKWTPLWRIAGKYANISVFNVESPARDPQFPTPLSVHGDRSSRALSSSWLTRVKPIREIVKDRCRGMRFPYSKRLAEWSLHLHEKIR